MKFTINIPKKVTANKIYSGIHWGTRKAIVDKYHKALLNCGIKISRDKDRSKSIITTFYFKNRPLDCSNCFFMAKCCEDGLVRAGILIGDSPKYVKSFTCISKLDKNNPRIEIELI